VDENGQLFGNDRRFVQELERGGVDHVLRSICGLDPKEHGQLIILIQHAHRLLTGWGRSISLHQHLNGEDSNS
jgi:hypothetical protein